MEATSKTRMSVLEKTLADALIQVQGMDELACIKRAKQLAGEVRDMAAKEARKDLPQWRIYREGDKKYMSVVKKQTGAHYVGYYITFPKPHEVYLSLPDAISLPGHDLSDY